jgi:hypothetical protein
MKKIIYMFMLAGFSYLFTMNKTFNESSCPISIFTRLQSLVDEAKQRGHNAMISQVALTLIKKSCIYQFPITEYEVKDKLNSLGFLDSTNQVFQEVCNVAKRNY